MNILLIENKMVDDIYNQIIENIEHHKFKICKKESMSKLKTKYDLYCIFLEDRNDINYYKEKVENKNVIVLIQNTNEGMILEILKNIKIIDVIYIGTNVISITDRVKSNIQMLEEGENEKVN